VHLTAVLAIVATLLVLAAIAVAVLLVLHGRRSRPPAGTHAILSRLEEHGDRLHDLDEAFGAELENWAEAEVDIRRRILAADAAVQAHTYGRRRTDTYAVRVGGRDERGQGEAPT
jgi:hypothetical protein